MNKNEFLNLLRIKLDVLSQVEIDELIAEYSEHIDNKLHDANLSIHLNSSMRKFHCQKYLNF